MVGISVVTLILTGLWERMIRICIVLQAIFLLFVVHKYSKDAQINSVTGIMLDILKYKVSKSMKEIK